MAKKTVAPTIVNRNITIEQARIGFKNFTGKEGQYNPVGNRNFCIFLEDDIAQTLADDGWNIKYLEPRDPEDGKQAYLPVAVAYGKYPPRITMITGGGKSILDEDSVNILDWAEFENVDLIVRPYNWDVNGKQGVKAYLHVMYAEIIEDELAKKYRNVPDSASASADDKYIESED